MSKSSSDPIKEFLKSREAPAHLIKGGLEGLVRAWSQAVGSWAGKDEIDRDDYLNDLDARQLLADALKIATTEQSSSIKENLDLIDEAFDELTKPVTNCVWGTNAAKESGWTAKKNPWYFAVPRDAKLV